MPRATNDSGGKCPTPAGHLFATLRLRLWVRERVEHVATEIVNAPARCRPLPHCRFDNKPQRSPRYVPRLCFAGEHDQYTPPVARSIGKDSGRARIRPCGAVQHAADREHRLGTEDELSTGRRFQVFQIAAHVDLREELLPYRPTPEEGLFARKQLTEVDIQHLEPKSVQQGPILGRRS